MEKKIPLEKADAQSLREYFAAFNAAQSDLAVAATVILRRMGIDPTTARVNGMDGDSVVVELPNKPARAGTDVIPPKGGRSK